MTIINYLIILSFLCVFSLYYNILTNIISFDYIKVKQIIKEPIQIDNTYDKITIRENFIAILETGEKCNINVLNDIIIDNIIKQIKNNNKYYTIINQSNDNKCINLMTSTQIIYDYLFFYFLVIFWSIVTTIIFIHTYYDYYLIQYDINVDFIESQV